MHIDSFVYLLVGVSGGCWCCGLLWVAVPRSPMESLLFARRSGVLCHLVVYM